jgi:predicted transcriptional regulator
METFMSTKREPVTTRLDPEVWRIVEQVAEVERRPISNLIRNIVADWARAQTQQRASV